MLLYDPTMTQQVPTWIYIYLSIAIFLYQLLDALDGKQARRTGTSSPLGELFDHGWDAITWVFMAILYCHLLSLGGTFSWAVGFIFQFWTFMLFTWEKRFTHVLRTAVGNFGTLEVHYIYMVFLVIRGVFGKGLVTTKNEYLSKIVHFDINLQNLALIFGIFGILQVLFFTVPTAFRAARQEKSLKFWMNYFLGILQSYLLVLFLMPKTVAFT
jgi:ethanolaminephosphotransferase